MKFINYIFISIFLFAFVSCSKKDTGDPVTSGKNRIYNITEFGAVGDSTTLNTKAIQKALDKAHKNGGTVLIPKGHFLTGTIFLKSNTILKFEAGAVLMGSTDISDYKEMSWGHNEDRQPYHLIVAENAENIKITGPGLIDGQGFAFWSEENEKDSEGNFITPRWIMPKDKKVSPLIEITECKNVFVKEVTIKTGGGWNLHLHNTDKARITGVSIDNNTFSPNSDAIDITGCEDIMVSDCYIKTCDDGICLKTTPDSRECNRVTVTNSVIRTNCAALKLGSSESYKDMKNVTFSNCVVHKSSRIVALYSMNGGVLENINVSNISGNTNAPLIFNRPIQLQVEKSKHGAGGIRNVNINNFACETEGRIILTAQEGTFIENLTFSNIKIHYPFIEDPRPMVEGSGSSQFPENEHHTGAMSALATIVADNVQNLVIDNLNVTWPRHKKPPEEWQYPERIENGSQRVHKYDYSNARQTELGILWAKNLKGGYIDAPLAKPSVPERKKYMLHQSDFKIRN